MLNPLLRFLGDSQERAVKKLRPVVAQINALEPSLEALSDEEFRQSVSILQSKINDLRAPDELLIEVFAHVREAAKRTIGQRHYDVQLIGGIVLYQGKIAEMQTGEGKTLVATLPLSLYAMIFPLSTPSESPIQFCPYPLHLCTYPTTERVLLIFLRLCERSQSPDQHLLLW